MFSLEKETYTQFDSLVRRTLIVLSILALLICFIVVVLVELIRDFLVAAYAHLGNYKERVVSLVSGYVKFFRDCW